ncbi:LysM peptidoglycan-binding domain-containing protein [Algoriphagus taiwanensis]|uniref:LysM domain-containing protein n=1 Tax=Algoriphagus taiwanensis TaxID=1445656 RepID=A0ABQ6PYQ9_9BACT|nr:hypothetical protein Ataiwa_13410 [Algoriphagus taiwanensis]
MILRLPSFFFLSFFCTLGTLLAQIPQVPSEMEFADLIVRINPQAKREIQLDVDALYRNPTYFKLKNDRVNLFMPIVERELRKQGVPDDLKYLVIQESGLIADAVSTSNAVGFWQFKQGTAEEVGLRVDGQIDERKNIVTSTQGAAKYLKKHQAVLDNWMTALVSYQMGLGGAKSYFGNQYSGKKVIEVDRNSHWYFKKYLAHKVAYEGQISVFASNQRLAEVQIQGPATFSTLAKRFGVSEDHLKEYNKWAVNGKVPAGTHTLFYIAAGSLPVEPTIVTTPEKKNSNTSTSSSSSTASSAYKQADSYPRISGNTTQASKPNQIKVNDLDGVQASTATTQSQFADRVGLKEKKLRKLNDLEPGERIETGKYYYTEKKKAKADVETHIVQPGETLWSISQKYGIRLASLKAKNRIRSDRELKAGMVLQLQEPRKRGEEIQIVPLKNSSPGPRTVIAQDNTPTQAPSSSAPKQEQKPSSSPSYHIVNQGETLFAISRKYGITVEQLKSWNNIGSNNIISIGQKLVIFQP